MASDVKVFRHFWRVDNVHRYDYTFMDIIESIRDKNGTAIWYGIALP